MVFVFLRQFGFLKRNGPRDGDGFVGEVEEGVFGGGGPVVVDEVGVGGVGSRVW
tara:strand:+ start:396 stop:557 length:162 start_codon:yes stop_codon:yes gene_type:complete